ncbi:MAG TPA: hypothetical protein DCS09_11130 [Porphyromonadaceae bacterium]|nr:hypothetical protein [Porphyromonadaceae bacterium]
MPIIQGDIMKRYSVQNNIGKAKYVVNHHNGADTHKDGSPFFAIAIFHNKKKLASYVAGLRKEGYGEI